MPVSVALGRLGPPELSKLLFEAHLFKYAYKNMQNSSSNARSPEVIAQDLVAALEDSGVLHTAPSIGIPVMMPDGKTILRGPRINVPELMGHGTSVSLTDKDSIEKWIRKGWIDLRPKNITIWIDRFQKMIQARAILRDMGSASASIRTFMGDYFEIGEVVAWIFNNELGGYRVK